MSRKIKLSCNGGADHLVGFGRIIKLSVVDHDGGTVEQRANKEYLSYPILVKHIDLAAIGIDQITRGLADLGSLLDLGFG